MKALLVLLSLVVSLVGTSFSAAEESAEEAGKIAEKFYAGYVAEVDANRDTNVWIAKSSLVTEKFKKAYAKIMNAEIVDADPVLNAQDIPSNPFKVETAVVKEDTATVVVVFDFGDEKHRLKVKLVKVDGAWRLDTLPE